jgi:hypothetical protein
VRTSTCSRAIGARIGEHEIDARPARVLRVDADVEITAGADGAEALVLQGRPIGEPVAQYGPFVMNDRAGIEQAFADYRATGSAVGRGPPTTRCTRATRDASPGPRRPVDDARGVGAVLTPDRIVPNDIETRAGHVFRFAAGATRVRRR